MDLPFDMFITKNEVGYYKEHIKNHYKKTKIQDYQLLEQAL